MVMRSRVLRLGWITVVLTVVLASVASAAYRGQITEARANLATKKIKIKGVVECFRTPGEIIPGTGISYMDGCGPGEEELWAQIDIVIHNKGTAKGCRSEAIDPDPNAFAKSKTVKSFQPEGVTSVRFSFSRTISIYGAKYVCIENRELTDIPITGAECSGGTCFFDQIIAGNKIKWFGRKP